jgi:hypothetical protein
MTTEQLLRFWDAGQRRLRREERARLAGLFAAFADALRWVVVPLWAGKNAPRQKEPWYLGPEPGEPPSGKGLAQLVKDLGGQIGGLQVERGGFEFRKDGPVE